MTLLIDRVRERMFPHGVTVPVIDATEIAEQIDQQHDDRVWEAPEYGACVPPYTTAWIEATTTYNGQRLQRGVLYTVVDDSPQLAHLLLDETRWVLAVHGVVAADARIFEPRDVAFIQIAYDGRVLTDMNKVPVGEFREPTLFPDPHAPELSAGLTVYVLKAIAAMNSQCRASEIGPLRYRLHVAPGAPSFASIGQTAWAPSGVSDPLGTFRWSHAHDHRQGMIWQVVP